MFPFSPLPRAGLASPLPSLTPRGASLPRLETKTLPPPSVRRGRGWKPAQGNCPALRGPCTAGGADAGLGPARRSPACCTRGHPGLVASRGPPHSRRPSGGERAGAPPERGTALPKGGRARWGARSDSYIIIYLKSWGPRWAHAGSFLSAWSKHLFMVSHEGSTFLSELQQNNFIQANAVWETMFSETER